MQVSRTTTADLLEDLVTSGIQLRVVEDELQYRGSGLVDDELRERLRQNKTGLKKLLRLEEGRWVQEGEWAFSIGKVPSQVYPGAVDLWVLGERQDKEGYTFWFVGREGVKTHPPESH